MALKRSAFPCAAALLLCLLALAAQAAAKQPAGAAQAGADDARYALANGCYALRSRSAGRYVAKAPGGGYSASAASPGEAEVFRMQATALGQYLFYGRAADYMAAASGGLPGSENRVETATRGSESADWRVDVAGGSFRISLPARGGRVLAAGGDGTLALAGEGTAGDGALFTFERADGCPKFPEVEVNVTGEPSKGRNGPHGEIAGFLDAHLHMMAFEFIGGSIHCGRPWHPYGVEQALVDCPDHGPQGTTAAGENTVSQGNPVGAHDTVGWPTFNDWPAYNSLTHEQTYYKWMERSWRGGLRLFVNLLVDNGVLCELYPIKRNTCNEMDNVRIQLNRIYELQDYIDAQNGGPGKGWFRIVTSPFEARRVIADGKLAVVLGIENSRLFDCTVKNDVPQCTRESIDRQIDEFYRKGVRGLELVNKFDNALVGVAGDTGSTGVVTNTGNRYETGRFWQLETCTGPGSDRPQLTAGPNDDALLGVLQQVLPPGTAPAYPEPPHCNTRGLSRLGEHVMRRMVEKGMIFDPDHMSQRGRDQALALMESQRYSGVISSHSWSSLVDYPRIYALGGVVTPYAGSTESFVKQWRETKPLYSGQQYFGFGYGADMNGFGTQGAPRGEDVPNKVQYPFKSWDGAVTIDKQRSGERVYDVNVDGMAHYGLYPDWVEDLRKIAGDEIVADMSRGAEAYIQMWERATGIPAAHCRSQRARFNANGLGRIRLGELHSNLLRRAGQPAVRGERVWRWCTLGERNRGLAITSVLTPSLRVGVVTSAAPGHRLFGVRRGARASRVRRIARPFGRGVYIRRAPGNARFVYGVSGGRVTFVAVATRGVAKSPASLRRYLTQAGVL